MVGFYSICGIQNMVFTNQNGEDTNQIGRFEVLDVILHRHFMDKWEDDCEVDAVIYEVGLHDMGHILTFAANYRRNCSGKAAKNVKNLQGTLLESGRTP